MVSELWFSRLGGQLWAAAAEDGRIVEIHHEWPAKRTAAIGSIHLAKVRRVVTQLEAAFVSLAGGCEAYLEGDDLPGEGTPAHKLAALRPGEPLVVQVRREAFGDKRARVSAKPELTGTFMSVRPQGQGVAVSRRIEERAERDRLADWARRSGGRVLLRTAAAGVDERALEEEHETLVRQSERLAAAARERRPPECLDPGPALIERLIRDYAGRGLQRVVVETDADVAAAGLTIGTRTRVDRHDGPAALIHASGLWKTSRRALDSHVRLGSGATLAIESTEALWAIDVNAAAVRARGARRLETAAINTEAAQRIAAEIRLRDIAGTILIDFLEPADRAERELVANRLREALRFDRRYLRVGGWTRLGLCELARRRVGPGLLERLGPPGNPTPWGAAAEILAQHVENPRPGRVVSVDDRTAAALRASIETSERPLDLKIEVR
ncbi:MAG: hypothetical protein GTN89_17070 [Acidobacteria bacterium]|nr:hypothetical protein [Acidobacteriota bacterium]NIM64173.1 hypothetical protein [Acidobacteriota bacterium]NIO60995.1 hypothetical protein [Acidobacteriota bacterium]NIQ32008.1 hypothetical protein [Acidobacteriota bacterium]NIQ87504.1 hypothetical protein [Acidobacteriota bacterium]